MSALRTKPYTFGTVAPIPLPWRAESNLAESNVNIYGTGRKRGQHKQHVAVVWSGSDATLEVAEANAELIVRACNAHDELVAALAACDAAITCGNFTREHRLLEAQKAVRAALAKVQA